MSPDTSAQDAPVASQEAEARMWRELYSGVNRTALYGRTNGSGKEDRVQIPRSLVDAIRATERERYAPLVKAAKVVRNVVLNWAGSEEWCAFDDALAALEEAESA